MNLSSEVEGVDTKHIEINGLKYLCVFYSGSSLNIVSKNFLKQIKTSNVQKLDKLKEI